MKLSKCIEKNFKVILRSKIALLVTIISPLLIFFIINIAYNVPEQYALQIGVYSDSYSTISNQIIDKLQHGYFTATKTKTEEECVSNVKTGLFSTCIILPPNMSLGKESDYVKVYVDNSRNNLVWAVKDIIQNIIEGEILKLSKNITANIIKKISYVELSVTNISNQLDSSSSLLTSSKENITEASSNIQSMELSFDFKALNLSYAEEETSLTRLHLGNAMVKLNSLLEATEDTFDELESQITESSLNSSEEADILELINNSQYKLTKLANNTFAIIESANSTTKRVAEVLSDVTHNLKEISVKLSVAILNKQEALQKLNNSMGKLNQTLALVEKTKSLAEELERTLSSIKIRNPSKIVKPFEVKILSIAPVSTQLSLIFPQLIAILILFIGLVVPAVLSVRERNSAGFFRVLLSPVRQYTLIIANYITNLTIMLVQFSIVILLGQLTLKLDFVSALPELILAFISSSSAFIMLGILLGRLFHSEQSTMLAALSLGSLLLFASGIILPLETMPRQVYQINQYNPLLITVSLLRKHMFYSMPLNSLLTNYIVLLVFIAVCFSLGLVLPFSLKRLKKIYKA